MTILFKNLNINLNSIATYIKFTNSIDGHNQHNAGLVFNVFAIAANKAEEINLLPILSTREKVMVL